MAKLVCSCEHKYQDEQYGNKVRVATPTQRTPSPTTIEVRCTVCTKAHTVTK